MSVPKPWLDAGCISASLTGCVSDSECAAARRCLLRLPPSPHEIGLQAATRALVGTFGPHHSRQMTERAVAAYLSTLSAAGLVVEQDWQPIETAPRDGTWIWCWHEEQRWKRVGMRNKVSGPRWYYSGTGFNAQYADDAPTHWRPLPAAPMQEANDDAK